MATVIDVVIRDVGFDKVDHLKTSLDGVKNSAQKASQDGLERLTKNGGAMGILNDLTGGLAMGFKDAYESIQLSNTGLKGMKAALLATGIGALVVAVGAIASNWEEIMKWANATSKEVDQQISRANELREITKLQYDILVQSDNILKSQGKTEEEIVELKRQALNEDINALKLQIEANKLKKQELIDQQLELEYAKSSANIFAQIKGLFSGNSEALEEQVKLVGEQEKEYLNLTNTLAGIELQQKAAEKARFDAAYKTTDAIKDVTKTNKDNLAEREKDEIDSMKRVTQAQRDELDIRNEMLAEKEHEAGVARLETISVTNAEISSDTKKMQSDNLKDEETLANAKKSLATSTFGFLQTLAEVFGKGNDKRARTAFQVSKALSLAEATANTWQAVTAVLTDKTYVGPSRFIAAASAGLMGLSSIAKIASTQFNSGGGGGGSVGGSAPSVDSGGVPQGQSPQAAIDFSFLQQQPPLQTYVIGSEVKTANEATQKIKDQSTL